MRINKLNHHNLKWVFFSFCCRQPGWAILFATLSAIYWTIEIRVQASSSSLIGAQQYKCRWQHNRQNNSGCRLQCSTYYEILSGESSYYFFLFIYRNENWLKNFHCPKIQSFFLSCKILLTMHFYNLINKLCNFTQFDEFYGNIGSVTFVVIFLLSNQLTHQTLNVHLSSMHLPKFALLSYVDSFEFCSWNFSI